MAHVAASVVFQSETIQLADEEGEKLAGAVEKVLRHYDLPDIASETKDWIGLLMVAGTIYGTRIAAAMASKATPDTPARSDDDKILPLHPGQANRPGPGL